MSALGTVGQSIAELAGSTGDYSLIDVVKNKGIQKNLDSLISDYGTRAEQDSTDLNTFIKNYLAGNADAKKASGEEIAAVDRYYNGDVERQLAELRARRSTLGRDAVARAVAANRGNINRSLISGGGSGDSSYNNRVAIGDIADYDLNDQISMLGQERADMGALNQAQLDLSGRRTGIANALAARALVPGQQRQALESFNASDLNNLTSISNANNLFGAKYNPTTLESIGTLMGGLGQAYSQYMGAVYSKQPSGPPSGPTAPTSTAPVGNSGGDSGYVPSEAPASSWADSYNLYNPPHESSAAPSGSAY